MTVPDRFGKVRADLNCASGSAPCAVPSALARAVAVRWDQIEDYRYKIITIMMMMTITRMMKTLIMIISITVV